MSPRPTAAQERHRQTFAPPFGDTTYLGQYNSRIWACPEPRYTWCSVVWSSPGGFSGLEPSSGPLQIMIVRGARSNFYHASWQMEQMRSLQFTG